jgi:hypothetical protein
VPVSAIQAEIDVLPGKPCLLLRYGFHGLDVHVVILFGVWVVIVGDEIRLDVVHFDVFRRLWRQRRVVRFSLSRQPNWRSGLRSFVVRPRQLV